jgi:glycosyltransferase involved in cell wall biosynthesis
VEIQTIPDRLQENELILIVESPIPGYANAIKRGLECVDSPFVAFQDSDDLTNPYRLASQIDKLTSENADICNCLMVKIDNLNSICTLQPPDLTRCSDKSLVLLLGSFGANSTWVMRRELLDSDRLFDYSAQALDWNSALKNFPTLKIVTVNRIGYFYRMHDEQMTRADSYKTMIKREIYPNWSQMNLRYGLADLSIDEYQAVCFPNISCTWNSNTTDWCTSIMRYARRFSLADQIRIRAVLGQRWLQTAKLTQFERMNFLQLNLLAFFIVSLLCRSIYVKLNWNRSYARYQSLG